MKLHWFWRAVIAVGVACLFVVSLYYPSLALVPPWSWWGQASLYLMSTIGSWYGYPFGSSSSPPWQYNAAVALVNYLPPVLVALATYGLLTWLFSRRSSVEGETRCRKCGYILRGISEPRCSECGERI